MMIEDEDSLSVCCGDSVTHREGVATCDYCRKVCETKPKTLGVDVKDEVRSVDKGPGQL